MLSTTTNNIRRRLLPYIAGVTLFTTGALADEVSYTDTIPLTTTMWTDVIEVPKFDPNFGILLGVEVEATASLLATLQFESQDQQPSTITLTLNVTVDLFRPDLSTLLSAPLMAQASDNVSAYDGNTDFRGTSGRTFPNLMDSAVMTYSGIPPTVQDVADFVGPAGNPGTIQMPASAGGTCAATGSANVTTVCQNQAGVSVTVTYFFGQDCNDNGIPDEDDIKKGTSDDCNNNGIPDECEPDCDDDGIPDDCEPDCNGNGIPDDCDKEPCPDCVDAPRRTPASLLVYPEFNNRYGELAIGTVTNTNSNYGVRVHFIYIGRYGPKHTDLNCLEFDRTEVLTPNDTVSFFTSSHNPQQEQGFFYAYAVDASGNGIAFDYLIGHLLVINGIDTFKYAVNPIDYRAGAGLQQGDLTDLDNDNIRDLNGQEYEETADEVLIPRFLGQEGDRYVSSKVIFLTFSGGSEFTTSASLLIYNDNEEAFSAQHTFRCWDKLKATEVSQAFRDDFLKNNTAHDLTEYLGAPPYELEYGWVRVFGKIASSTFYDIPDPAVYAVWIAKINGWTAADLPWELCTQDGHLFPRSLTGDNEE